MYVYMYILVEIIHTEFQYISLIEMQKYNWNRKRIEAHPFVPVGVTFCPGCQTRDKRAPLFVSTWCSRLRNQDNRGFPTRTNQRFCSSGTRQTGLTGRPLTCQIRPVGLWPAKFDCQTHLSWPNGSKDVEEENGVGEEKEVAYISTWKASPLRASLLNKAGTKKRWYQEHYRLEIRLSASSNKLIEKEKQRQRRM